MNLLVSYDWLKEYVSLPVHRNLGEGGKQTHEEFAARISLSGPSVEKIFPQGEDLAGIYVGKILKLSKHPQADKLTLADVDIGKKEPQKIVCGGSNLYEGQIVAVAVPGSKVRWHGEGDLIELGSTEIRGERSDGMICAANEVGLGEAFPHAEREILDLSQEIPEMKVNPGTPLAEALGLSDDVVMDMEVTSNRPDSMGMVGIAREASAILKVPFKYRPTSLVPRRSSKAKNPLVKGGTKGGLNIKIDAKDACSRYIGTRITGVKVGPSPWWLKRRLLSAGIRPINNLVDITNYVMYETGQPMHVFDTTKLSSNNIIVRYAQKGEKIQALDGKDYELTDRILVIADDKNPIAIAGVMGGEQTGADENTTDIVLEAAAFDPVVVRKGSRQLLLQSDSQLRFEKGLSQIAPEYAMARAIELVLELAGGEVMGSPVDVMPKAYKQLEYSVTTDEVSALIGIEVKKTEMVQVLKDLGFSVKVTGKKITAKVPWWRDHDIEAGRDLVEEIARVIGYSRIPSVVPVAAAPRQTDAVLQWEDRLKDVAKGAGYTEVYGWSFVSEDLLKKASYNPDALLHVQNPLSNDWLIMRPSLVPSMLQAVADNQEREDVLKFFECSHVYVKRTGDKSKDPNVWTDVPDEVPEFTIMIREDQESDLWKKAKGFIEYIFDTFEINDVHWKRVSEDSIWHPGKSAQAYKDNVLLATIGEITPMCLDRFKIKGRVGCAVIDVRGFIQFAKTAKTYTPPLPFPEAKRDLALVVDKNVDYRDMELAILRSDEQIMGIEWFDTYIGKGVPEDKKSVAMHLTIGSKEKTLTTAEVDGVLNNALLACKEKFKAIVRA